jgi:hypothetical protein
MTEDPTVRRIPATFWTACAISLLVIVMSLSAFRPGPGLIYNAGSAVFFLAALGGLAFYRHDARVRSTISVVVHLVVTVAFAFGGGLEYYENQAAFIVLAILTNAAVIDLLRSWSFTFTRNAKKPETGSG